MASKQRILIVDDDENIAELISLYLTKECYETKIVYDGESALSELSVFKPNLVLLDLMLPGIDGYQVCREIRKNNNVPIIMLSAKGETFDKVLGLELGADDYIIKPFETKEMVARVKAVLRRYHMPTSIGVDSSNAKCVNYPDLSINLDNYSVNYMGKNVEMPPKELELLYFLASAPNQVFTREQLLDNIWGYEYSKTPEKLNFYSKAVDIHGKLILAEDGSVWNISGNTPSRIAELKNIVEIASGDSYYSALDTKGQVWVWGYNGYGSAGNGTTSDRITTTQADLNGKKALYAKQGWHNAVAITTDGLVMMWGYAGYGTTGLGNSTTNTKPTVVADYSKHNYEQAIETMSADSIEMQADDSDDTSLKKVFVNLVMKNGEASTALGVLSDETPADADALYEVELPLGAVSATPVVFATSRMQQYNSIMSK